MEVAERPLAESQAAELRPPWCSFWYPPPLPRVRMRFPVMAFSALMTLWLLALRSAEACQQPFPGWPAGLPQIDRWREFQLWLA